MSHTYVLCTQMPFCKMSSKTSSPRLFLLCKKGLHLIVASLQLTKNLIVNENDF